MKIEIENYKNIKRAEFNIENNKVNFIFGISGSGKSSIANALVKEAEEDDKKIGEFNNIKILVDDQVPEKENYRLYCEDTVNDLVVKQTDTNGIYNIFFDDEKQLEKIKEDYNLTIISLRKILPNIFEFKGKVSSIEKEISSSLVKGDIFKKTAKINKIREELEKIDRTELTELEHLGSDYIEWKITGTNFEQYYDEMCPFCNKSLDQSLIEYIDRLKNITPKNFKNILDSPSLKIIESLGIDTPDLFNMDEVDKYIEELIDLSIIGLELDKVIKYGYITEDIDIDIGNIESLELKEIVYDKFPELKTIINSINNSIEEMKIILINLKREMDRVVNKNIKLINENLSRLGLPYKFDKNIIETSVKKASYILKHVDDDERKNRTKGLSYGEKNILSLLLFLIIKDNKILIIDDPASSYDEYRRKTIFDLIYLFQRKRTILVFSHDQVFSKLAAYFYDKDFNNIKINTGIIVNFENYTGIPKLTNIEINDFKSIDVIIKEHMKTISDDYYRKIVNLRLLGELCKYSNSKSSKIIYCYISAILHRKPREYILTELLKKDIKEEEILDMIAKELGEKISPIPINYEKNIKFHDWTNFEIAMAKREITTKREIKEELDNIVHLNDTYAIPLNPYKYDYFSPYIYNLIKKGDEKNKKTKIQ